MRIGRPAHCDYLFASTWFAERLVKCEVMDVMDAELVGASDHAPVTATFEVSQPTPSLRNIMRARRRRLDGSPAGTGSSNAVPAAIRRARVTPPSLSQIALRSTRRLR